MHTDSSGLQPPSTLKFSPVPAPSQELKNEVNFQCCKYPVQLWYNFKQAHKEWCAMGCKVEAREKFQTGSKQALTRAGLSVFVTAFSSFVPSQLSTLFLWEYRGNMRPHLSWRWWLPPGSRVVCCSSRMGGRLPAQLPACLLSSKHTHGLSQQAAATAASRDFNELAAFLQSTYLPPAAPCLPLLVSSLPAPILAAPRQRERGIIYCVPVENERLLHFNEH